MVNCKKITDTKRVISINDCMECDEKKCPVYKEVRTWKKKKLLFAESVAKG